MCYCQCLPPWPNIWKQSLSLLIFLPQNLIEWMWLADINTLTFYGTELLTAVKRFTIQSSLRQFIGQCLQIKCLGSRGHRQGPSPMAFARGRRHGPSPGAVARGRRQGPSPGAVARGRRQGPSPGAILTTLLLMNLPNKLVFLPGKVFRSSETWHSNLLCPFWAQC